MSNTEKVFVGSGKIVQTKFGAMTKLSFSKKDLQTMMDNLSEQGWINVVLKEKQNKVEGKSTHYLEVDNWKPTGAPQTTAQAESAYVGVVDMDSENLPF
tara:strand:- start:52 stop:348 length:297 start_codon:yes stop_codon:yes gene_type:complete